jgi:hypothetical protein
MDQAQWIIDRLRPPLDAVPAEPMSWGGIKALYE